MDRNRENFVRYIQINEKSGGSALGRTWDEEAIVTFTERGEFVCEISELGELVVEFPDSGLSVIYDDEGVLGSVAMDIANFLENFSEKDLMKLPCKGEDVRKIIQMLLETATTMTLEMNLKNGTVEVVIIDIEGRETRNKGDFNFFRESNAVMTIGGINLAVCAETNNDGFMFGMGEMGRTKEEAGIVHLLTVSNNVNFIDDVLEKSPRSLQSLARKILLN